MVMAGTFPERIDHLSGQVGHGDLIIKVTVDQVYAHYQEVGTFSHPEGGKQFALRDSLYEGSNERQERLASRVITPYGSEIRAAAIEESEKLSDDYFDNAPLEVGDLKGSGHPTVIDDGAKVYDRPPNVARLSKEELRIKHRTNSLFRFDRRR